MANQLRLVSAVDFSARQLADLMNRGFEGYVVPIHDSPEGFAWRLRFDHIDLSLSLVAMHGEQAVGMTFLAPRGTSCRMAAMGVSLDARGQGIGRQLAKKATENLRELGYESFVLEVIASNTPALRLYESIGFEIERRLVGYRLEGAALDALASTADSEGGATPERIDASRVAAQLAPIDAELPWQLRSPSIQAYGPQHRVYSLDGAVALVGATEGMPVLIHVVWVPPELRRQGRARRLLTAIAKMHPSSRWTVPARVPERLGVELAHAVGAELLEVGQFEMTLDLTR